NPVTRAVVVRINSNFLSTQELVNGLETTSENLKQWRVGIARGEYDVNIQMQLFLDVHKVTIEDVENFLILWSTLYPAPGGKNDEKRALLSSALQEHNDLIRSYFDTDKKIRTYRLNRLNRSTIFDFGLGPSLAFAALGAVAANWIPGSYDLINSLGGNASLVGGAAGAVYPIAHYFVANPFAQTMRNQAAAKVLQVKQAMTPSRIRKKLGVQPAAVKAAQDLIAKCSRPLPLQSTSEAVSSCGYEPMDAQLEEIEKLPSNNFNEISKAVAEVSQMMGKISVQYAARAEQIYSNGPLKDLKYLLVPILTAIENDGTPGVDIVQNLIGPRTLEISKGFMAIASDLEQTKADLERLQKKLGLLERDLALIGADADDAGVRYADTAALVTIVGSGLNTLIANVTLMHASNLKFAVFFQTQLNILIPSLTQRQFTIAKGSDDHMRLRTLMDGIEELLKPSSSAP
ncbi:MAG: hypothetical protein K2X47_08545, partial [Bdellovibrionales bacterium]|nr:hypothetical protein [Bdellovibrionales bacterium]